jgi:hypothetical protein
MAVQKCPHCGERVWVPDRESQLLAKCPTCGREFDPPIVEVSDIDFKCTRTGQPFVVRLTRSDPDAQFTIADYTFPEKPEKTGVLAGLLRVWLSDPSPGGRGLLNPPPSTVTSASTSLVDDLAKGLSSLGFDAGRLDRFRRKAKASLEPELIVRSADLYNWAGFNCPCCKSDRLVGRCDCGFFGCQGTAEVRPEGRHWRCSCGWNGVLSGSIKTVEEKRKPQPTNQISVSELQLKLPAREPERLPAPELKRLPAPEQKRLPAPELKRLPPPSKRLPPP